MSLLFTICALHFVAQLSPGPDVLLIAKSSASTTQKNTLKTILGISVGIVVWVVLTLLGFTVLIEKMPWIQQVLMVIGGVFLARMGWLMLKAGLNTMQQEALLDDGQKLPTPKANHYFMSGLLTNLSNPKTLIYSLALSSSASPYLKMQLAVIIPIQTFMTFALLMLLLSLPKIKAAYQRSGSYIDIFSGGLFLIFALWLWYDALAIYI